MTTKMVIAGEQDKVAQEYARTVIAAMLAAAELEIRNAVEPAIQCAVEEAAKGFRNCIVGHHIDIDTNTRRVRMQFDLPRPIP